MSLLTLKSLGMFASVSVAAIMLPTSADAATFLFTFSGTAGSGISGSGTITTGATNPAGSFYTPSQLITGIMGTFNGSAITGLVTAGTFFSNDNILYAPSSSSFNGLPTYLDLRGVAFTTATSTNSLYFGLGGYGALTRLNGAATTSSNIGGVFSISPVAAVPEPATWAMMLVGFSMMGASMRYRRRSTKAVYA